MSTFCRKFIVMFLAVIGAVWTQDEEQKLVDYYIDLINTHTQAAENYEFPKDARMYEPANKFPKNAGIYDFIVIGAGSTGCVIANRLSEITKWKVLLLEAGTFRDGDLTGIPSMSTVDVFTKFNWGFESIPQKTAFWGATNNVTPIVRGKGVGGSSLINGLGYTRGSKFDFQRWSELLNDNSWNYNNLLPLFKKSENFTRTNFIVPLDEDFHGYDGPLHMTQCLPPQNESNTILKGAQELGYDIIDVNGRKQLGGSIFQFYIKDGKRFDPEMAFISPLKRRYNLKVRDRSYVTKIAISKDHRKVKGVFFTRDNKTYVAKCRKEVILSAGAISSPQLLMLSGIGPREHLESLKIRVVQDLPVGTFLKDHPFFPVVFSSNLATGSQSMEESVREFLKGRGSLARPNLFDAVLFLRTQMENNENYSNVEYTFGNLSDSSLGKRYYGWTNETYNAINVSTSNPFSVNVYLMHSTSNGTVRLKSNDPFEYPLIDPNMLSDPDNKDVKSLYQGLQLLMRLIETEAFRSMNVKLAVTEFPGCNHTAPLSKEYWYCYIRSVTAVGSHQVGSCLSGVSPETAVVDKELKVFGVDGLRVADASVIPFTLTAHINAACTMIGEKVSDMIKRFYER